MWNKCLTKKMLWAVVCILATLTEWELGTCGRCPVCLLSTRTAWLRHTSGLAVQSTWQKGWSLGRGGSLASPSTSPSIHRCCFGHVRSLSSHLWPCPPPSLAKPFWACWQYLSFQTHRAMNPRCSPPPVQINPFFSLTNRSCTYFTECPLL